MLFLVKGRISISHYMQDKPQSEYVYNLVDAVDKYDADRKFREYYLSMTSEYSVYYTVNDSHVCDTII